MAFAGDNLEQITQLFRSDTGSLEHGSQAHANSGAIDSSSTSDEHTTTANYPGILDTDLTALTPTQRSVFTAIVALLFVLSLGGNIGTLRVNFRRKIRPFFRACLISLALSDMLSSIFLTLCYMGQFTVEYVQIWHLGSIMCSFVPFATTAAILASSMTLVGIALDRYFAVMKAVIGFWNPGVIFCLVCMLAIWAVSIGIASPVFVIYTLLPIYILTQQDVSSVGDAAAAVATLIDPKAAAATQNATKRTPWETDAASREDFSYTLVRQQELVVMCVSNRKGVALYYVIVFSIIFIPCIVAFIWLNSIIAKKLWIRRHSLSRSNNNSKNLKKSSAAKSKCNKSPTNSMELLRNITPTTRVLAPTTTTCPAQNAANCNCRMTLHSTSTTIPSMDMNMGCTLLRLPPRLPTTTTETIRPLPSPTAHSRNDTRATPAVTANSTREARHIRMFTIILLMMAVFLLLRLPAWIFLVMRMYGSYSKPIDWTVYFCFGILNLTSCVLNPLFYTFLAETIQLAICVKVRLIDDVCGLRPCCKRRQQRRNAANFCATTDTPTAPQLLPAAKCCGCLSLLRASLRCYRPAQVTADAHVMPRMPLAVVSEKASSSVLHNADRDEGVECSDASDDGDSTRDFYEYRQRIYTIFPPSLVSSSVTSQ